MYRILTEDKNRESIFRILDSHVDGYTVTPAIGSWKGVRENSLAIDLVGVSGTKVNEIAHQIGVENSQESVLIVGFSTTAVFVDTTIPLIATAV